MNEKQQFLALGTGLVTFATVIWQCFAQDQKKAPEHADYTLLFLCLFLIQLLAGMWFWLLQDRVARPESAKGVVS